MRFWCSIIGLILGILAWKYSLGHFIPEGVNSLKSVFISSFCCIAGGYIGKYIGALIEYKQEEERQEIEALEEEAEKAKKKREQAKKRKEKEENERLRKQRRQEAISLCNKYPEAAKYYFKFHFGIEKERITQYHITHDKVGLLLAHSESDYKKQEAISLCNKYPEAAKYYFKSHFGLEMDCCIPDYYVTDNRVGALLAHSEADYQKQEEAEKAKKELAQQKKAKREKALYLCNKYPRAAKFYFWTYLDKKNISEITDGDVVFLLLRSESEYRKQEEEEIAKEEERKRKEAELAQQKEERRNRVASLCEKYPLSAKYFLRKSFRIRNISKITDKEVDILLSKPESEYIKQEELEKAKEDARKRAQEEARKREEERKRREEELARQREEEAKRQLESSLRACVSSWETHIDSSLKHKYYYDYYPYGNWKDNATPEMRETWKLVWNFKNDPAKGVNSYDHKNALEIVINKVENTLRSTFGSKTEYLTFVCLTASTQRKTEMRYKEFAERVCKDLKMTNAYPYIWVAEDGDAKHDGGDGSHVVSHNIPFFKGKYVVLFDDVRTSGNSLEEERDILQNKLNAKVICTITIAQTR